MLFLARRGQVGDGHQHGGIGVAAQALLNAALAGGALPLVGIGGEPLHDGGFVRVLLLYAGNQCQPCLLPRDALVIPGRGALHHRGDGRADGLLLFGREAAVHKPRILHHLLEAGAQALVGVVAQIAALVFLVAFCLFLLHMRELGGRGAQQQAGDVGLGLVKGGAPELLEGVLVGAHLLRCGWLLQFALCTLQQRRYARQLVLPVPGKEARDGLACGAGLGVLQVELAVDPPIGQASPLAVAHFHGAAGLQARQRHDRRQHDQPAA